MKPLTLLLVASVACSAAVPSKQQVDALYDHTEKLNDLRGALGSLLDPASLGDKDQANLFLAGQSVLFVEKYMDNLNSVLATELKLAHPDWIKGGCEDLFRDGLKVVDYALGAPLKPRPSGAKTGPWTDQTVAAVKTLRADLQGLVPAQPSGSGTPVSFGPLLPSLQALVKRHKALQELDAATFQAIATLEKTPAATPQDHLAALCLGQGLILLETQLWAVASAVQVEAGLASGFDETKAAEGKATLPALPANAADRDKWKQARATIAITARECADHMLSDVLGHLEPKGPSEPSKAVRALFAQARTQMDGLKVEMEPLCQP